MISSDLPLIKYFRFKFLHADVTRRPRKRYDEESIDIVFKFIFVDVLRCFYEKHNVVIDLPHSRQSRISLCQNSIARQCITRTRMHSQSNIFFRLAGFSRSRLSRFACRKCGRGYTMLCNLRRHTRWECGGKRYFPCGYCYKSFTQKTSLERHLKGVHKIDFVNEIASNLM